MQRKIESLQMQFVDMKLYLTLRAFQFSMLELWNILLFSYYKHTKLQYSTKKFWKPMDIEILRLTGIEQEM